ncbi:MAG: O-antigen ligase family protein [Pseudomonadota bacterium]
MGFFLTLVYIVVLFIRPQEFITEIRGWPVLDFLAGFSMAAVFLEGDFRADKFRISKLNTLIIWFWMALAFSQLANFWLGGASLAFQTFGKVVIVYFLIVLTVDTWPKVRLLCWLLIFMGTFLAANSVYMYYTGVGLVGGESLARTDASGEVIFQARGIGIFEDPNDLALSIIPMVSFVLPAFHKRFLSRTWLTGLIFLIPMVAGIIYTRSRGGILGLVGVVWVYFRKRIGMVAGIFAMLMVLSFLMVLPRMGEINTQEASARSRLEHWSNGLGLFRSNPLFGVGMLSFEKYDDQTAHNSLVLILAETGFVGTMLWIAMFYVCFRDMKRLHNLPNAPPFLDRALDGLEGAIIGWMVAAFFLSQTYKFLLYVLMGLLVAYQNALANEGVPTTSNYVMKDLVFSAALTVGAVMFLYAALRVLWNVS